MASFLYYKVPLRPLRQVSLMISFLFGKLPFGTLSLWQTTLNANFFHGKLPLSQTSLWQTTFAGKLPAWQPSLIRKLHLWQTYIRNNSW